MVIPRSRARWMGAASIGLVLLVQAFNSFACYKHDIAGFLTVSSFLLAYYTDCVRPYSGGGASMVYVLVFMYGTLTSLIGALMTNLVTRKLDIQIAEG